MSEQTLFLGGPKDGLRLLLPASTIAEGRVVITAQDDSSKQFGSSMKDCVFRNFVYHIHWLKDADGRQYSVAIVCDTHDPLAQLIARYKSRIKSLTEPQECLQETL